MRNSNCQKFQLVHSAKAMLLTVLFFLSCPISWAAQDAVVIVEKAIIYADREMTSPLGYTRRGKKIRVGEISRNRSQVYPIVVSGKMAFIKVSDVSTETEAIGSNQLVSERFFRADKSEVTTRYSASYFNFNSNISMENSSGFLQDNDVVNWHGLSFKGEGTYKKSWGVQGIVNLLRSSNEEDVTFNMIEVGLGGSIIIFELGKLQARAEAQFLGIPFSNYAIGSDFQVNGYGFTTGGGAQLSYQINENWGAEVFSGVYYTKITRYRAPNPYGTISPSFMGYRLGFGANYRF